MILEPRRPSSARLFFIARIARPRSSVAAMTQSRGEKGTDRADANHFHIVK
jgi:hypothetical protein